MVKIISDSTCDLSQELLERYGIAVLPLQVTLGEASYEDGINITVDEIYRWADENKTTPKTAAPSVETAANVLRPWLEKGMELVCFSVSESMSTSANVMRLAAKELKAQERVTVINSQNLSTGVGLLVIEAAIMAKAGKSAREITESIKAMRPLIRASFVVDTLTYLHRGGRCSGVAALAGSMLKLHPKIVVSGGKMGVSKKYRGKLNRVLPEYVEDMKEELLNARTQRVFITHSGCEEETIRQVKTILEGLGRFEEILVTRAGSVISSHCGPGTLGVLFIANE
ncbi:MAG: DegV family protein [Clostridiales bacterium]|nr:DegV family protein [Clostridiales bacterium]